MQSLRNAVLLARLVLAWFALSIGVAIAAPVVKPQAIQLICSGAGVVKIVAQGDDDSTASRTHTLDCPLCMAPLAPAPAPGHTSLVVAVPHAFQPIPAARVAALTAAPLSARGPPASALL